jgi:hypothetical protein
MRCESSTGYTGTNYANQVNEPDFRQFPVSLLQRGQEFARIRLGLDQTDWVFALAHHGTARRSGDLLSVVEGVRFSD